VVFLLELKSNQWYTFIKYKNKAKSKQEKVKFSTMRSFVFFGGIGILSIAMLYLVYPFIYPIFWAAVIAIMFYPIFEWVHKHLKSRSMSSALLLLGVILVIFIPLTLLSLLLVNESVELYNSVSKSGIFQVDAEGASRYIEKTALAPYADTIRTEWTNYASQATRSISNYLFSAIKNITQNSLRFFFMAFIMLYTLFYFFKDGERMLKKLMKLCPLGDRYEKMLFEKFTSTTRATLKSTFLLGGLQGILGGLMFWFTGIQGALVWGVIMAALSIIPVLGSFIVWLPAGIIMLAFGSLWQGLVILLFGSIVIGNIDNILRPVMVGKDIQMHPLLVLFSTLGGILAFGVTGFIIGPIIAALYMAMVSIYHHYYKTELEKN